MVKFTSSYNQIHKNQPDLTNDEKLYFIKTYIDTAYKLMLKNKKSFNFKGVNSIKSIFYSKNTTL